MEIYIDFRPVTDKATLAQAIKVFAMTYKEDNINVIVGDDALTLENKDNLHILKEINIEDIKNLFTVNDDLIPENCMKLLFLNTNSKEINTITFGDLNHNNLSLEDKISLLKEYKFIHGEDKYAIMSTSLGLTDEYSKFIEDHKDEAIFGGMIMPKELAMNPVKTVLTTSENANVFIDSLLYAIEFLNLKEEERDSKESIFSKMFSFGKSGPKIINENALYRNYCLFLNKDRIVYKIADEANYNYYYNSLVNFYNILAK